MIVRQYVETAEPVGSRYIARKLGLSSATIRNAMADLEDEGYITQPHTSAGRIPTDKGYRYYIDSLMRTKNVNERMKGSIQEEYNRVVRTFEDILEMTSHIMSSLTNYVGITLLPDIDKLYMDGTSHMIAEPEFRDFKKLYYLIKCLEERKVLLDLLKNDFGEAGLTVHIGRENRLSYLVDCSIVTRGYKVKGKVSGRLGVIGPKRMVYEKVIPAVDFLADTVTELLEGMEV